MSYEEGFEALRSGIADRCPWCGMFVSMHARTFVGRGCDLRIAVARLIAQTHIRSVLRKVLRGLS